MALSKFKGKRSKYIIVLDIVGLDVSFITSRLMPTLSEIANKGEFGYLKPVFPAVTSTVQTSVLSGKYPDEHGIISNGLYDRENLQVRFWEQSGNLVQTDRIWDILNRKNNNIKTSVLFWQNTMFAKSDYVITPKPIHLENGQIDMWCYSRPPNYYEEVAQTIGDFDLFSYWGPFSSFKSTEWIAKSVEYTLQKYNPNLLFAYLPQLDYSSQKFGKDSVEVKQDIKKIDNIIASIITKVKEIGKLDETEFVFFSEYAFNNVDDGISINKVLREKGLLQVRTIKNKEYIDFEYSKAFAMVDHQIANIFVSAIDDISKVKKVVEDIPGIEKVCSEDEKKQLKINHLRSGELIAISAKDKWFNYHWWHQNEKAPTFTKTVDIHRKPGYDPLELFIDPQTKSISFNTKLIKGSHGRPYNLDTGEGLSTYISSKKIEGPKNEEGMKTLNCTDIFNIIKNNFL